ncbi:hypothetical protein HPP92_005012 [Vanilla planifolia]|uniref:Bifunctional inhibitor/plant lipid transfer protein/seed storage helical domain-containing protein n=1 Tax=Vanilla planifolia TaxID=51239 RepID=A0A835RTW6_VANPL|nr:hypothetical protein HPP92_005350 [Vanilla planifolia]KAG0494018.1 hypothetical protein HPP92_005012 [Vanilla planifolia]
MGVVTRRMGLFAVAMLIAAMVLETQGQQDVPTCAEKLVPCANFLGSSKPPESCCGPIKEAVKDELPCLCSLFNNSQLLKAFNVNVTQALELPKNCGIQSNQSICNSTSTSTKGSSAPLASTTTPASSSTVKPAGSASRSLSCIGVPGLIGLMWIWWTIVAQQ